jgi:DNA-binding LytR/AlgR family response regulator
MVKIAIVEDEKENADELYSFLKRYEMENNEEFDITCFESGTAFLGRFHSDYEIVFMDIEMPNMDGMETAKNLRRIDDGFCLVFVTNLAQYAIDGYELNATDYLLKPLRYFPFSQKINRILKKIYQKKKIEVVLSTPNGKRRVFVHEIRYIEVNGHTLIYHLKNENLQVRDTLSKVEASLSGFGFARCNSCYIVNMRYVTQIEKTFVLVENAQIQISRSKRTDFMKKFAEYLGSN